MLAILAHPRGGTLVDLRRFLLDERFRKEYLAEVPDEELRFFWERGYAVIGARSVGPLLSRLDAFLRSRLIRHIVGQAQAKLDLAQVMRSGKIFLAKLSRGLVGEEHSYLLGSLLVAKFHQLAIARQGLPKDERRPFFLYADEFQQFLTPSMESLLTEGRKYRLGLVLAHQTIAQLSRMPALESALLGNAYTRIVFRVGEADARKLAEGCSYFRAADLLRLPRGEAIARIGGGGNDFNLRVFSPQRVAEDVDEERRNAVIAQSRERYATPVGELVAQLEAVGETAQELAAKSELEIVEEQSASAAVVATGVSVPKAQSEPAQPPEVQVIPTTMKKKRVNVPPPEPAPLGRGGQEHKYIQHLLKRLAEERGFRAVIEDAAGDGRADVVLRREKLTIGCEISITTDVEHELENLRKCLQARFVRLLFISPDKKRREKITARLSELGGSTPIDVIGPEEIVTVLDGLSAEPTTTETVVRGYKVKVTRQTLSPEELTGRRSAVAGVIARSLGKSRGAR
ncbi:MAG: type IV secretory system conjugative DNA transfer family protein [Thiobacillaceae bacterium]